MYEGLWHAAYKSLQVCEMLHLPTPSRLPRALQLHVKLRTAAQNHSQSAHAQARVSSGTALFATNLCCVYARLIFNEQNQAAPASCTA